MSSISIKTGPEEEKKIDEIKKIVISNIQYSNIINSLDEVHIEGNLLRKIKNSFHKIFLFLQGSYKRVQIRRLKSRNHQE